MSSEKSRSDTSQTADPRSLRALAHPVRLDLLYLLEREGPLTASQAAEHLGLTPKTCSYHLNQLGKYGVVEETGAGKGRSRPWQLANISLDYVHRRNEGRATARKADAFARTMLSRDAEVVAAFIEQRHRLPKTWRNVSTMSSNPMRLTPAQLRALRDDLTEVLERYLQVSRDAGPDAHPVHTAVYAVPAELSGLAVTEGRR